MLSEDTGGAKKLTKADLDDLFRADLARGLPPLACGLRRPCDAAGCAVRPGVTCGVAPAGAGCLPAGLPPFVASEERLPGSGCGG